MKILYITDFLLAAEQGAKQSSIAHLASLRDIFSSDNVDVAVLNASYPAEDNYIVFYEKRRSKPDKLWSILRGVPFLLSPSGESAIVRLCRESRYGLIFVDHSIYGHLLRRIKTVCDAPVVSYFHGVIRYQSQQYLRHGGTPFSFLPARNIARNEKLTVEYSDICLLLNRRDAQNYERYYHKTPEAYLPVYYADTANIERRPAGAGPVEILFVGGYFWPNVHGVSWFAKNVMPELGDKFRLTIVGNGMEKLSDSLSAENVRVHGRVASLDDFYNRADVVVGPIFEGEGMKTKTCEALMYGKRYIGTKEALEGYEGLDEFQCDTKEDFIRKLREIAKERPPKFHADMRELYEKSYSPAMARERLTKIFADLGALP